MAGKGPQDTCTLSEHYLLYYIIYCTLRILALSSHNNLHYVPLVTTVFTTYRTTHSTTTRARAHTHRDLRQKALVRKVFTTHRTTHYYCTHTRGRAHTNTHTHTHTHTPRWPAEGPQDESILSLTSDTGVYVCVCV